MSYQAARLARLYCDEPVPDDIRLSADEAASEVSRIVCDNAELKSLGGEE